MVKDTASKIIMTDSGNVVDGNMRAQALMATRGAIPEEAIQIVPDAPITSLGDNVIAIDPRRGKSSTIAVVGHVEGIPMVDEIDAPVITDYALASQPKTPFSEQLAAEAVAQLNKLGDADKRAGTLRILSEGRTEKFAMNPYLIKIKEDWNCRILTDPENLAHIDSLARSIASIPGVQEALTVVLDGNDIFLTDGHMRLLATFRAIEVYGAQIATVPVQAEPRFTNPDDHLLRQLLSGKPKTPMEMANVFVRLTKSGWSVKKIADRAGLTQVRVDQILAVYENATPKVREMIETGKIAFTEVQTILGHTANDAKMTEQVVVAGQVEAAAEGKTRVTAKHIQKATGGDTQTLLSLLREIFEASSTTIEEPRGKRIWTMSVSHHNRLLAKIGRA